MFGWELPPYNSGGLGTACLGLAKALCDQGAQVTFVLPKKVELSSSFMKIVFAGVESKELFLSYADPGFYTGDLQSEVREYARRAALIARDEEFDIIHAHDWLAFGAGMAAKNVSGKPLVVHVHATEFDRTGGSSANSVVYALEKEGMQAADTVIAISNFTKSKLVEKYQIGPEKIRVVHNGVESIQNLRLESGKSFSELKKTGKKIVAFVGRITLQKGPDYFLRAAKRVLEFNQKVYFLMVGSGDMERQMILEAANLGIADKVFFTGFLRGDELEEIYGGADLLVMPSVSEPFGIVPLEAMIRGTPVIISKQSGVSEVVNHAFKVDFWDVEGMAEKMLALIALPSLAETMRHEGLRESHTITWAAAAAKCLQLYKILIGNSNHTVPAL